MSGTETKQIDTKKKDNKGFECAEEAAALLNCVTDKNYNEMRCLPLLKKLRACVEKKVGQISLCANKWIVESLLEAATSLQHERLHMFRLDTAAKSGHPAVTSL